MSRRRGSCDVRVQFKSMTAEEKVGQLVLAGFQGTSVSADIKRLIRDHYVGGVILFSRNIASPRQTLRLVSQLQHLAYEHTGLPLIVAIDQEGGLIARMRKRVAVHPGNMALGAAGSVGLSRSAGEVTGGELKALGINMNLAPVLDVNTNPRNPVIGVRSFGEDVTAVSRLGVAMIQGLQRVRVIATAKHFPGHGDTAVDSHESLPVVKHRLDRLRRLELKPFQRAVNAGVKAIMVGHISLPALQEEDDLPASLSKQVVSGLLRRQMGFSGLIITDCMEMKAVSDRFEPGDAAVRALTAGADLILVSHSHTRQLKSLAALRDAVGTGKLEKDRIDQCVQKIIRVKSWLGRVEPSEWAVERKVGSKKHLSEIRRMARRSITLLRSLPGVLPFRRSRTRRILCLSFRPKGASLNGLSKVLTKEAPKQFNITGIDLPLDPEAERVRRAVERSEGMDATVVATVRADLHQGQATLLDLLNDSPVPLVVVSTREPYDLVHAPANSCILACYSPAISSLLGVCDILLGKERPTGQLPVTIPGLYPRGYGMRQF